VVILLLGKYYGEPLPDSGVATTEEEFLVAKRRGVPILVFRKAEVDPEERQRDFINRVGDYVQGRFWREFRGASDLGVAVLEALREIAEADAPLQWVPTGPVAVRWRVESPQFVDRTNAYTPLLEAHLAAVAGNRVLSVADLESLQQRLIRAARAAGLFTDSAAVRAGSDSYSAWATSTTEDDRRAYAAGRVMQGGLSGVAVDRAGSVLVFKPLPRDSMGGLIDKASLTADLPPLLRLAAELVPPAIEQVVPAAAVEPFNNIMEGDPKTLGRSSASVRTRGMEPLRTEPEDAVPVGAFPAAAPEVAVELAARLMAELRMRPF
jgi:hypothetical protein